MNLQLIFDNTSDAIVNVDCDWRYTDVNNSAEMLFRRKRGDLIGKIIWEEFPDLQKTPAEANMLRAAKSNMQLSFEQFIPGLYAWHSVQAVPHSGGLLLFYRDISDRVRALRESAVREGIRNILENVPVAITITRGAEHRIELQNARSRALLSGRDVEGMMVKNALPEAGDQGFIAILDSVFNSGQAFEGKAMPLSYDRDGSGVTYDGFFDLIYQPIFETGGKISGILHLGVDITERVNEKSLLARYAAERNATLEQLVEGVILTNATGQISFVNEAARRLHGVAILDVAPEDYSNTYHLLTEEGLPYPSSQLPLARAVLHNEVVQNARWRIRRPDNTDILVEGNAQPIFDEHGQKIACVLILREV